MPKQFKFDEIRALIKDMESETNERREGQDNPVQCSYRAFDVIEDRSVPLPLKIQEPTNSDRVIRFKASDDTIDRYNEVILPSGWDLRNFKKNPAVLQFHDHYSWPIGKSTAAGVVGNALMIDAEFDPPEVDESAELVFRKIKHGSVKAGSVGFLPSQWIYPGTNEKGVNTEELFAKYKGVDKIYIKQELLEWTICPIGANPEALAASLRSAYSKRYGHEPTGEQAATGSESTNAATEAAVERLDRISKSLGGT